MTDQFAYPSDREQASADKVSALERLLIEKGVITSATVDKVLAYFESEMTPLNGKKIVVKAWTDPDFAAAAGFPRPILHGLCTYGVAGRALVAELCDGDATRIVAIAARFSSPVFPGETLTTSIWRQESGAAVFRTEASAPDGSNARLVLDDGVAEFR